MIFNQLIQKYDLRPNSYVYDKDFDRGYWTLYLVKKWNSRVAEFHYGFDGLPNNVVWFQAIDEMLDIIEKDSPDFKIMQIKLKFGGIRIYLLNISDAVFGGIEKIEQVLYDEALIY